MLAEDMLAAYLMRLSIAAPYRVLGTMFDMSRGHVRFCCRKVGVALMTHFGDEVRLPTAAEARVSAVTFATRFDIHGWNVDFFVAYFDGVFQLRKFNMPEFFQINVF